MHKKLLFDSFHLNLTIDRLTQQLLENYGDELEEIAVIGLQPRGIFLADRIAKRLEAYAGTKIKNGLLDITFYRDDFRRREIPLKANQSYIPFLLEERIVILIDDVIYTGRSVRAALDAMNSYGRPRKVELLVLIDRLYSREIPIEANYSGMKVNTMGYQKVSVQLKEQDKGEDQIWLIEKTSQ